MKWFIGGPAYNMKVDARHAGCVASLAASAAKAGDDFEIHYEHNSILPQGRARWLGEAFDSRSDIAITMDADTWVPNEEDNLLSWIRDFDRISPTWSIFGVLVSQRDGRPNVWKARGSRIDLQDGSIYTHSSTGRNAKTWLDVYAIGLACAVYRLRRIRKFALGNEGLGFAMMPTGGSQRYGFVGEDVWHCEWLRRHGASIHAIDLGAVHGGW